MVGYYEYYDLFEHVFARALTRLNMADEICQIGIERLKPHMWCQMFEYFTHE